MDLELKGKTALITGANHGLGVAISKCLAAEGANIALNYVADKDIAIDFVNELESKYGIKAEAFYADISKENDVNVMFKNAVSKFKKINILINNAAISPTSLVKDTLIEDWNKTIQINLTGIFLTSKYIVNHLIENKIKGRIVNMASTAAFAGSTSGRAHYDASKGGVISFTFSLAREVGKYGINVNAIAPGMMMTEMTRERLLANKEKYLSNIPLNRFGEIEEIANVAVFLASDKSSYMTGAVVNISGGLQMR